MTPGTSYRRLPGRSGIFVRSSLWIQPDHVLRLRRGPFSEEYRRYYFSDIQAIVLTELPGTGSYYGYAIAAALGLGTAALVATSHIVSAILLGLLAVIPLLIALRWRNCACYLKTMVSTEELPSLRRLGTARKALLILKTEIQHAQGVITPETLDAERIRFGEMPPGPKPETPHFNPLVHWILFGIFLLRAILAAVTFAAKLYSFPFSMFQSLVGAAVLLMAIIAAVKQHRTDLARGVKWLVYSVLSWYVAISVASLVVSVYIGVRLGRTAPRNPFDTSAVMNHPAMRYTQLTNIAVMMLLAGTGLILLWMHHSRTQLPPPIAPQEPGVEAT